MSCHLMILLSSSLAQLRITKTILLDENKAIKFRPFQRWTDTFCLSVPTCLLTTILSLGARAKTTARTYANVHSQQETVLWHLHCYWQMLRTDTHHWTFVSMWRDCGYRGLRFGGFSPANEILTPWQSGDQDKTQQYELSALILLHVCNCSLWKWDGGNLADRYCWERADLLLIVQREELLMVEVWII